ncbi:MAG TPA: hypothetical protein VKU36_00330 [Candidatus Babeliales bacterium]|nr:hypothetical protein [Candidatus Babeliales bacterium]
MEAPQQEPITITQSIHDHSNTRKTVNKTLQTTLAQKQRSYRNLKEDLELLKERVLDLTKLKIQHHKNIESLNENVKLIDEDFIKFDDRCLTIEMLCKSHTKQINELQSGLKSYGDSIDEDLLKLKKEQTTNYELLLLHMGSYASTEEKVNTLEESLASLKKALFENEALNKQATLPIIQEISELKNSLSHLQDITVQQTQYANIEEKVNIQEESLKLLSNNQTDLQNIITQQTQSISILRKWLMFMGGGSALALTIWLWHYTHK